MSDGLDNRTDPTRAIIEDLLDAALACGCLVWLDATEEIVLLEQKGQGPEARLEAEAITRKLMADDLRSTLLTILSERRSKALAAVHGSKNLP